MSGVRNLDKYTGTTGWSGEVNTFVELPVAIDYSGQYYMVKTATGLRLLFTYKATGLYYSDGVTWKKKDKVDTSLDYSLESTARIYDIVNKPIKYKHLHDINYTTEIESGKKLHGERSFDDSGTLVKTELYTGFVDDSNKGTLVIRVDETYTMNPDQITAGVDPTALEPVSKSKTRTWINKDGSDNINTKITSKFYDHRNLKSEEGIRRRRTCKNIMVDNIGIGGILSGTFTSPDDVFDKMTLLLANHTSAFSTWIETGRGSVYDDLTAEIGHVWLDTIVVDTPSTQLMCPQIIGMSLKNYIISKLKGRIK